MEMKFLTFGELQEANRRAIQAECNSIDPEYVKRLPRHFRYPVFFTLPYERHGWVRCQVGTGVSGTASDYVPCLLDVPKWMYDALGIMVVKDDETPENGMPTAATTEELLSIIQSDARALLAAICNYDRVIVQSLLKHLRDTLEQAPILGVPEADIARTLEEARQSDAEVRETWTEILGQVSVNVWLEDPDGNRVRGETVVIDRMCWENDDVRDLLDDAIQQLHDDLEVDWEVVGQS